MVNGHGRAKFGVLPGRRGALFIAAVILGLASSYTDSVEECYYYAWIALAGLIWICSKQSAFHALWLGCAYGAAHNIGTYDWGPDALSNYLNVSSSLGAAIYLIPAAWESLLFGFIGVACSAFGAPQRLWLVPFAMTALDGLWPKIFPWQLGLSQSGLLYCVQAVDLSGISTLTFWFCCGVTALCALCRACFTSSSNESTRPLLVSLAPLTVVIFFVPTYGVWRCSTSPAIGNDLEGKSLTVGVIQVQTAGHDSLNKMKLATNALVPTPDVVCWPESALGEYNLTLDSFADKIQTRTLSRKPFQQFTELYDVPVPVIAGGTSFINSGPDRGQCLNTAFLISDDDRILDRYHKQALMPFGEYLPFQDYLPQLRSFFSVEWTKKQGTSAAPVVLPDGTKVGILICYEDTVPSVARREVKLGAEVLIGLADLWAFPNPKTLRQHFRLARMRAVENRRYFVACTTTGISANVDPWGRIVDTLPMQQDASMVTRAVRRHDESPFTTYGDWLHSTCLIVSSLGCGALLVSRRRNASVKQPTI